MIPMERGRIFKILTEIFPDEGVWRDACVVPYIMKEDASIPHDINFVDPGVPYRDGYHGIDYWLRIIDPRDDCPEYNFVLHSAISNKDANIAIDGAGNYRIYGDEINSVILTTIKSNIQKFCDYAVELTELENKQAFEHVVAIINSYTNELMDIHAGEFVQRDVIPRNDRTYFVLKKTPYLWHALCVDVLRYFNKESAHSNDVWVGFDFDFGNLCCTPIHIYPFRHEVKLDGDQLEKLTGDVITMKECVRIAKLIAKELEYVVTTDSGNTWVKKAVGDINKPKEDEMIGCEDVFNAVIEWLSGIRGVDNITRDKLHQVYSADVINTDNLKVTERLEVSYAVYMRYIRIYLGKEHIITIDDIGDPTAVYITNYHQKIDLVLNKYLVACLAERLKEIFKLDKLRAYVASKCGKYTELTHNGPWFFNDDGKTAFCCDPSCAISALPSTNKLKLEIVLDGMSDEQKKEIDDVLNNLSEITNPKSKLENAKEPDTPTELATKDSIEDEIHGNLNDFQKRVYKSIYVAIFCALVESKKFVHKAFEFEKYFTHYVSTDRDSEGYHVFFRYDRIHNGLPGFEIVFYDESTVYLRYVDYLSSQTLQHPLAMLKTDGDMKIYLSSLKYNRHYDPSILASVAAKLVHVEGLP